MHQLLESAESWGIGCVPLVVFSPPNACSASSLAAGTYSATASCTFRNDRYTANENHKSLSVLCF